MPTASTSRDETPRAHVYDPILTAIGAGGLASGRKLAMSTVARERNVSITPVRLGLSDTVEENDRTAAATTGIAPSRWTPAPVLVVAIIVSGKLWACYSRSDG